MLLSRSAATALSEEFHRAEAERDALASAVLAQYVEADDDPDEDDNDPVGDLDRDTLALLAALAEFEDDDGDETRAAKKFDEAKHPRNPKGGPGGGRFKSTVAKLVDALGAWNDGGRKGDPFPDFDREQLRRAAKTRGITLRRGATRDEIVKLLVADLRKDLPDKPDANEAKFKANQERQKRIDAARKVADVSATFQELVNNGADKQLLLDRLDGMEAAGGDPDLIGKLRAKLKTRATPKTAAKLAQAEAAKRGLSQIGVPDQVVKYDPREHDVIGEALPDGAPAVVVKPGHRFADDTEDILLDKALVAAHQDGPAASFDARLASARAGNDALDTAPAKLGIDGQVHWRSSDPDWPEQKSRASGAALSGYQAAAFTPINNYLRSPGADPEDFADELGETIDDASVSDVVAAIDDVMAHSRLSEDAVVWRGSWTGKGIFGDRLKGDLTGFEWEEHAYTSTSASPDVVESFAFARGVIMRIVAPKGVGAVQLSNENYESELLLQRGLRMRVVRDRGVVTYPASEKRRERSTFRLVDVEIIVA